MMEAQLKLNFSTTHAPSLESGPQAQLISSPAFGLPASMRPCHQMEPISQTSRYFLACIVALLRFCLKIKKKLVSYPAYHDLVNNYIKLYKQCLHSMLELTTSAKSLRLARMTRSSTTASMACGARVTLRSLPRRQLA